MVPRKRARKIQDSFDEPDGVDPVVVDFSRMTKRQRMTYMHQGGGTHSTTEVSRHNKEAVLHQGDDQMLYALGHKKPRKVDELAADEDEELEVDDEGYIE